MNRLASLIVAAAAATLSYSAYAQVPAGMEQLKPYLQVKPVAGDEETVRVFFSPNCQFSRSHFQFFKNLEATMPKPKTFKFTPLVNKGDGLAFALSFLAVEKYYPAYTHNFMEEAFIGAQDLGISTVNWASIDRIGKAAHVPVSVSLLVKQHESTLRADVSALLTLQKDLQVTNTPAVSVAGSYIVTSEFTNGDAQLFDPSGLCPAQRATSYAGCRCR